jgi:hypothetical protein
VSAPTSRSPYAAVAPAATAIELPIVDSKSVCTGWPAVRFALETGKSSGVAQTVYVPASSPAMRNAPFDALNAPPTGRPSTSRAKTCAPLTTELSLARRTVPVIDANVCAG